MSKPVNRRADAVRTYLDLYLQSRALSEKRAQMVNPTRAALTTANARWARAAEARDRAEAELPHQLVLELQRFLDAPE